MPLVRLSDISIAFGVHALLDRADFQLDAGERVGLIGRNGEGKSTLMKIIAGTLPADHGEVWRSPALRIAVLEQTPEVQQDVTVYDAVADGLGEIGQLIADYHHLLLDPDAANDPKHLTEMGRLHDQLDSHDGWNLQQRVETTLTRLNLPAEKRVDQLSGGWQRRVALARALVIDPELLLLDEPTNHLDLETILWLEEQLLNFTGAILFVTHDRAFLQRLATRIVDLDRGKLVSWPGDYADYLVRKEARLAEEESQNAEFDKKLAQEERWIRQGIKARRTRNEGRVRALKKLRNERSERRNQQGNVRMNLERGEQSGRKVVEVEGISHHYGDHTVINNFSTLIMRGDRIGLIGPNGCGKTTLINILLGRLQPDQGNVQLGTKLTVGYYDQLRTELDPEQSVQDSVGDGSDFVTVNGQRRHIIGYLNDFLFTPARARSPISSLSGGEKNRVMLARLFSKSANLLVMDEPTNDLDIETLELLETLLVQFDGTLLLVSHDRVFLDNIITSALVFERAGTVNEYVGGYEDWLRQKKSDDAARQAAAKKSAEKPKTANKKNRLSYQQKRELEQLPAEIESLEQQQSELTERISSSDFYQNDQTTISETLETLKSLESQLEQRYARWDALEAESEE